MGAVIDLPMTSRERALAHIAPAPVIQHPQANACGFRPVEPLDREPPPAFEVDRKAGCVRWRLSGGYELRLVHTPQFRAFAEAFADAGWMRNFNALHEAELALSEPDGAA